MERDGYFVESQMVMVMARGTKGSGCQSVSTEYEFEKSVVSSKQVFVGWSNASRFYYETTVEENVLHYEIVSLYPSVNKNDVYLIGHPEIILSNLDNVRNYFGLIS